MSRLGRLAAICGVATVVTSFALAQMDDPLEILRQSILARGTVDFSGMRTVVIFEAGEKVRGVEQQVQCQAPHRTRITVIAPESEAGAMCLIVDQVQWEYDPDTHRVVHTQLPPPEHIVRQRLRDLERIGDTMRLQYCGTETIAGRTAHVIKVYTQQGVPVKKSWVDAENWVALKTQRFDPQARVKSSAYFTRINYAPSFPPGTFDFEPPAGATVIDAARAPERMPLAQAEQRAGFRAVLPEYLPPGYRFQSDRVAVIQVGGQASLWLPFSNGADVFSLFQRPGAGPTDALRRGRSITWQAGDYRFTLLGPLTAGEMQRVKASIHP